MNNATMCKVQIVAPVSMFYNIGYIEYNGVKKRTIVRSTTFTHSHEKWNSVYWCSVNEQIKMMKKRALEEKRIMHLR